MSLVPIYRYNTSTHEAELLYVNPEAVTVVEAAPETMICGTVYKKGTFTLVSVNTGEEERVIYIKEPLTAVVTRLSARGTTVLTTTKAPDTWKQEVPTKIGDLVPPPYTVS